MLVCVLVQSLASGRSDVSEGQAGTLTCHRTVPSSVDALRKTWCYVDPAPASIVARAWLEVRRGLRQVLCILAITLSCPPPPTCSLHSACCFHAHLRMWFLCLMQLEAYLVPEQRRQRYPDLEPSTVVLALDKCAFKAPVLIPPFAQLFRFRMQDVLFVEARTGCSKPSQPAS
jgi:hypothetical protein